MVNKPSSDRAEELALLRDWSICIVRFICDLDEATDLFKQFDKTLRSAFDSGNLRGLRMAARDNAEWAGDLPSDQFRKLDVLLVTKFGKGLSDSANEIEQEIEHILGHGQIDGEDQYRLLLARAGAICEDESKRAELDKINSLLAAYTC